MTVKEVMEMLKECVDNGYGDFLVRIKDPDGYWSPNTYAVSEDDRFYLERHED